jgi:hypothetical protein
MGESRPRVSPWAIIAFSLRERQPRDKEFHIPWVGNAGGELDGVEGNFPSGAKACIDFCGNYGTSKLVPFQSRSAPTGELLYCGQRSDNGGNGGNAACGSF